MFPFFKLSFPKVNNSVEFRICGSHNSVKLVAISVKYVTLFLPCMYEARTKAFRSVLQVYFVHAPYIHGGIPCQKVLWTGYVPVEAKFQPFFFFL